ncbi:bifunctional 2-polyprenyl-6-hydroxyphenol methylase/3-demethylubiquinol 3-O-methyltransferase UbiG [Thiomicrorhabdus arctica]|uniref:bifunctional 2-polyprenyl-6-hydroxyphenol methylase/3-demethylubiquinol 3-O-methyltransferase UbiG n=1 Tax=Thiomicrorhabdus arctica TaxID=131540 RepID=UPI0003670385|nr:bifunctional 2-polyprenyl-6-hydroxyphenol methylase/3-demethylubiquinol 3-O-methyltransferase UbiG [Thiomicrorhabdus arctica]
MSESTSTENSKTPDNAPKESNVDQAELDNFNRLSNTWWDTEGEFGALHKINPFRIEFIRRFQPLENQSVVDIGCGGGILSESLASAGAMVTGIDLAQEVLSVAKLHGLDSGIKVDYQLIAAEEYAELHAEEHDIVTCMEMLEHVPDPQAIIKAAALCVKPGGWVFFSTLNRNYKSYLLAIFAAEQVLNLVPKGTHTHEKFITPAEMDAMARQAGLYLRDSAGIQFNPLLNQYGLNENVDVNYLLAYQKAV